MSTTGDLQLVKRINRGLLLRLVRAQPGLSRAQLAAASGLTKSTVSQLTRELLEERWLQEGDSQQAQGTGRPSTPLHLDGAARALLGVELDVQTVRVVAVSLTGEFIDQEEQALLQSSPEGACRQLAQRVRAMHARLIRRKQVVCGLGIGVPGMFDERTGQMLLAPNMGWRNIAFESLVYTELAQVGLAELPVLIRNEADTAAISELEFAQGTGPGSLVFVTCGVGVGAGLILNGQLFTGFRGMAGEIGHSTVERNGRLCSCGRRGCAETLFGARALAALPDPAEGGEALGLVLHNLWTALGPQQLVIGGASCFRYPAMVERAMETLRRYERESGLAAPPVRVARYGLWASAVGAAALVLHHELHPMHASPATPATAVATPVPTGAAASP